MNLYLFLFQTTHNKITQLDIEWRIHNRKVHSNVNMNCDAMINTHNNVITHCDIAIAILGNVITHCDVIMIGYCDIILIDLQWSV